jgi:hypothetical protein
LKPYFYDIQMAVPEAFFALHRYFTPSEVSQVASLETFAGKLRSCVIQIAAAAEASFELL